MLHISLCHENRAVLDSTMLLLQKIQPLLPLYIQMEYHIEKPKGTQPTVLQVELQNPDAASFVEASRGTVCCKREKMPTDVVLERDGVMYKIPIEDILYFETVKNGTTVYTKHGTYKTNQKLREWESKLQSTGQFAVSHHSVLVNLAHVVALDKQAVTLQKNQTERVTTYVSTRKYGNFKQAFLAFTEKTG